MPFELAAKKAGLSVVRAFLHSIEGVKPYINFYLEPSVRLPKDAPQSAINTKNTSTERLYRCKVLLFSSLVIETLEDAFPCRGDKK